MAGTSLLDPNILRNDPALGDVDTGFWDQFGKGLKSSVTGSHAGLRGMAGTVGEMAGADEFAQSEFQRARELQAEAQAQGPRIGSYKDAGGSLRDATSYAGGILGGSAPSMALGMGAGMVARTALGGLAAGTLAQTPLEAADVAMKQLNDPGAMAQPAGERFARQIGGGAASAGLQTIIPNMVGGKLVGRGAEQAAKQSIKQIAGRNAMSIPAEGFFEGSSEGLKQMASNNENDLNWDQIGENVVGGMVGGAPMAGAGFVGDTAGRVAPQAREAFGSARESINERLSRAKGAAGEQIDAAAATVPGKKIRSAYDDIADMVERGKGKFDDTVDKILKGEELGDPGDWLRATTDAAKKRMADFSDNERVKAATQWGKDMLSKLRPDDPRRGPVEAADPNTVDGQMLLASEKKKFDASEDAGAKIDAMSEALGGDEVTDVVDKNEAVQPSAAPQAKPTINQRKKFIEDAMASGMTQEQARTAFVESMNGPRMDYPEPPEVPTKLSADYSGVQKVIADAIKDNGIVSRRPELFDTDRKIEAISRNMRLLMEQLPKGPLDETVIKSVTRVFGDDTDSVIDSLKRTLAVDLSPQESENFFGNLRLMKDINEGNKGLHDVMRSSLTDEARTRQQMTEKDAEALIKHARGQMGAERTAEKEHFDRLVDEYYKNNFGDKADTVRAAVEKAAGMDKNVTEEGAAKIDDNGALTGEAEGGFDEGGSRIEAAAQDKVIYGLSAPDTKGNSRKEINGTAYEGGSQYAKQHMLDLEREYSTLDPNGKVIRTADQNGYDIKFEDGYITVENRGNPGEFGANDLNAMRMDKGIKGSKSSLKVGKYTLDAVKVGRTMRDKMQDGFERDTPTTKLQRDIEGFKQGIAHLTEQFGHAVEISEDAVVAYEGRKPVTWADAQKLDFRSADDKLRDSNAREQEKLREAYKKAKASGASPEVLDGIKEKYKELVAEHDLVLASELSRGDDLQNRSIKRRDVASEAMGPGERPVSPIRTESKASGTSRADNGVSGDGTKPMKPSKDAQIHEAARSVKENALINRSNMDGSGQYVSSGMSGAERDARVELKAGIANWKDTGTAPALKIADRATKLLDAAHSMSEKDRTALYNLAGGTAAEASATVNALARKYADRIAPAGAKGETIVAPGVKTTARAKELKASKAISAEDRIAADNFEGLDSVAKVDDFLKSAYAAWENGSEDRDVQSYLNQMFDEGGYASTDLASFYDGLKGGNAELDHFEILKQLKRTEGSPSPKPQAPKGAASGKKQAFLKRAAEGDKALLEELGASNDAKGLQRALEALNEHVFDGSARDDNIQAAFDVLTDRLSELVRDPDVAYGLQTAKYSLEAVAIHTDLGRDGFAATHDSPIRHEGKFDWRAHQGKGEGNAAFGAGTYLSTSDGVHRSYKAQFSGALSEGFGDGRLYDAILQAYEDLDPGFTAADVRGYAEEVLKEDISGTDDYDDQIIWDALRELKRIPDNALLGTPSPTYEVSVDIKPEQLLDWDKPLSEQSVSLREALASSEYLVRTAPYVRSDNGQTAYRVNVYSDKKSYSSVGYGTSKETAHEAAIKGLGRFSPATLYASLTTILGSQAKASDHLQSLGILGHKYAAAGGKNDTHPNYVIYDDSKITTNYVRFDKSAADPNAINPKTERDAVKAHILKVLGPTVKVAWKNLTTMKHAGDYTHSLKLIRLSVHALNPMSTGYHESLHAFFGQLRDAGATDITKVLEKAASSQLVIDQLKQRYAGQPEVLNQLKDPEERAAYMYQMWASDPTFKIAINAKSVFGRIKQFIQRLAGAWTNDERALHIMEYFHSGEYAKNMGSPSAVRHALMDTHRSQILETAQSFAEPLGRLADAVVGTGGARLRDTGVPALEQLADIMKREHTSEGGDQGFISASRVEGAKMRTRLGELLSPYTPEHLHDAMEALQSNTPAVSTEAQQAVKDIKKFLRAAHNYMTKAGVNIGDLGPDYFPRVWDTHYISKNQQAFRDMLEPYIRSGQMKGSADDLIRSLLAREGAEFGIESREPGMQHKKERLLDFITPQDSAQFVEKDLLATMSSYINQASRKAEWTRRLGGGKLDQLLDEARSQGATTEQLDVAEDYMKGIDGTLGATGGPFEMTPTARRLMGNMIVYQNIRLLPMAAFSMLIDPMGIMVRGGSVSQAYTTFKRGIAGIKDTFAKDGGQSRADQATKWAELIGVVDSAMMSHAMSDIYSQGMVGGTAQKINNTFFKYNLVEGLNRNFRIGASEAAMKFLTHHVGGLTGAGPSTHSVRWMKELGLQKGDIIVTPAGHLALTEQDGLSAAQVQRVHAAINQWVDGAVLRPDAADKPIWMNDPHYALISHLKQFVFSFQKTILARVAHEFRNGNYTPSMALASYVPIMIAADTAKGLLGNAGDTPEWKKGWTVADHVGYGVERAGLFGVGQFGLDIAQDLKRGGTGVGSLTGPTIDQLGDMVSTLGGRRQFGTTVLDALPANTLLKGWSGKGEADPVAES